MRMLLLVLLTLSACSQVAELPEQGQTEAQPTHLASTALPRPSGPLSDTADILGPADEALLGARLREIYGKTGHPIVVVTVASLGGETIEQYTLDLFNRWGVGGPKPGVVLLVAPNERKVRITTGRGLEQTLTDEHCAEIIRSAITPQFRNGDFVSGINAGVEALAEHLT